MGLLLIPLLSPTFKYHAFQVTFPLFDFSIQNSTLPSLTTIDSIGDSLLCGDLTIPCTTVTSPAAINNGKLCRFRELSQYSLLICEQQATIHNLSSILHKATNSLVLLTNDITKKEKNIYYLRIQNRKLLPKGIFSTPSNPPEMVIAYAVGQSLLH